MQYDDTRETIESADYLIQASRLLPNESFAHKLLKSHYLSKSRKLLDACGNDQRKLFSDEEVCRKCTTPWSDTNYSIVINPIQMTKRRAAKVKRTVENKQQKGLTKRVSKASNNIITVKCDLCENRKRIILWKKSPDSRNGSQRQVESIVRAKPAEQKVPTLAIATNDATDIALKKRKHKKDKTAGLLFTINKDNKQLQKVVGTTKASATWNAPATTVFGKNKPKPGAAQKPKVKMTNVMAPSNIFKKPNILRLADALKKKSSEPPSTADKLQQMLS